MQAIQAVIEAVYNFLWGDLVRIPLPGGSSLGLSLLVLILVPAGVYFTVRTRFLPFRLFPEMMRVTLENNKQGDGEGHISGVQALIVSTACRVGMGNLVGVVAAISAGGSGAVFWMWLIAIIGGADGPTAIYTSSTLLAGGNEAMIGSIAVAAYSYMALVPIIQPPIIKAITTKKERLIRMEYSPSNVSKTTRILFPIFVTIIAGTVAPKSAELIGFLMFGNLIRECGVLDSLSQTAQNALANLVTLLLGISVAFRMQANDFLTWQTLLILALGLVGFVFDTVGGVFFAKFLNLFSKKKINPMIGAAGISAFPMASRMVHKMGRDEDPYNFLLMHAAGANVSGQIASVIAGGLIITLVENLL